jgi:hypothetical protein
MRRCLSEGLIVGAVKGVSKEELLSDSYSPIKGYWDDHPLVPEIVPIAAGSFKKMNPPEIKGTAIVVQSLEAALWAFYRGESFRDGLLMAVNLGDDADTTGAIYGQIAGLSTVSRTSLELEVLSKMQTALIKGTDNCFSPRQGNFHVSRILEVSK